MRPQRIQLRRTKGWRMPPGAVKIDRSTPYGNPWRLNPPKAPRTKWWVNGPREDVECGSKAEALALSLRKFRYFAETHPEVFADLRGNDVGCWCALDEPCHGDIVLEIANRK